MSANELRVGAVGDLYLGHSLEDVADPRFHAAIGLLERCHLRFGNLEVVLLAKRLAGCARAPGAWAGASADRGLDLKRMGFDVVSTANNHAGDYGSEGVLATVEELDRLGIRHAGSGADLDAARQPTIIDTVAGRIAFVAATSSFLPEARAGRRHGDVPGRPGVSCVRFGTRYSVDADAYEALLRIAAGIGVDLAHHRERALARDYDAEGGEGLSLLGARFVRSDRFGIESQVAGDDCDDICRIVRAAREQADWVVLSLHSQEYDHDPSEPAAFARALCHSVIDAGADAVIGHGEHGVRGVEVYLGRPILHGLGPFVFQPYTHPSQPADFYEAHGMSGATLAEVYDERRRRAGFHRNAKCWESLLLELDLHRSKPPALALHPLRLRPSSTAEPDGVPRLANDAEGVAILRKVQTLSERLGTALDLDPITVTLSLRRPERDGIPNQERATS